MTQFPYLKEIRDLWKQLLSLDPPLNLDSTNRRQKRHQELLLGYNKLTVGAFCLEIDYCIQRDPHITFLKIH